MIYKCQNCGLVMEREVNFCPNCGKMKKEVVFAPLYADCKIYRQYEVMQKEKWEKDF